MTAPGASPPGWRHRVVDAWFLRLLLILGGAQFISSAVRPLLTYQSLAAGGGPLEVGLVAASFSGLALFIAIPLGRAVDRRGEVGFLVLGGIVLSVALPVLMAPVSLPLLAVGSAVLGAGHLALLAAGQTMIAKGDRPERRETRFATMTSVNAIGQILGPVVTGLVVGGMVATSPGQDPQVPRADWVLAIAAGTALLATLAAVSLKLRPGGLARRPRVPSPPARGGFRAVMSVPAVPTAMLASLAVLTCVDLVNAYLPVLGQTHGLSARTVGFLLAAEGVAAMVVRLWMLRLVARFSRRRLLVGTMTLASLSVATIPLWVRLEQPLPGLVAAMLLAGLGLGIGQPAAMAWVAAQTPAPLRGTAVSIRLTGNRVGLILVPLLAGSLAGSLGLAAAFWWPAAMLIVCAGLVLRTSPEREAGLGPAEIDPAQRAAM